MEFVELPIFTKLIKDCLKEDEYHLLQMYLMKNPDAGDIIRGACGLRKLRWKVSRRGKRGGLRIIYYWISVESRIYFFTIYKKTKIDDLSSDQLKLLLEYLP